MAGADDFLGRGWAFPVAPDAAGEVALVAAAEDIRQAILLILETEPGERVMRPEFGCAPWARSGAGWRTA
jgi:phage baseplate assembly protein W